MKSLIKFTNNPIKYTIEIKKINNTILYLSSLNKLFIKTNEFGIHNPK